MDTNLGMYYKSIAGDRMLPVPKGHLSNKDVLIE